MPTLSIEQQEYAPSNRQEHTYVFRYLVGLGRFELPTSPLSGVRSNQLSYRPSLKLRCHRATGRYRAHCDLERLGRQKVWNAPTASNYLYHRTNWWSWSGSNRRPPECKSGALPAELQPLLYPADNSVRIASRHKDVIEANWTPLLMTSTSNRSNIK